MSCALMAWPCHGEPQVSPHDELRDPFWPPDYVRPMLPGEKADAEEQKNASEGGHHA